MTDIVTPTAIPIHATTLPDPSDRGTFTTRGLALFQYETGTMVPGMNTIAQETQTNALAAFEAAEAAWINANFKGAWSSLAGALPKPALASHTGQRWNLLNDLADVTASVPGVSADWELYQLPPATGISFNNVGTSIAGATVQAALVEVSVDADTALVEFDNPVLNGDMRIAQTGTSFPVVAGTISRLIDGWNYGSAGTGAMTVSVIDAPIPGSLKAKLLHAVTTTADAAIAVGDYAFLFQRIEGFNVADYVDKTFTLRFWATSSVTGVHSISLRNGIYNLAYVGEINIATANVIQECSITVVGGIPNSGTWDFTNGNGIEIGFCMMAGTTYHGTVGAWQSGDKIASAAQVNVLGTIGNAFGITEVQINPGTVAKNFKRLSYGDSLARCQWSYGKTPVYFHGYGTAGMQFQSTAFIPKGSRTGTISLAPTTASNCASLAAGALAGENNSLIFNCTVTATGTFIASGTITYDRRL